MNGTDAAFQILREAGKPLHYRDIARRALQGKLWSTNGKTPEQTINKYLNQEIIHRGPRARFIRLGGGIYAAVSDSAAGVKTIPPDLAFVSDAWGDMPVLAKRQVLRIVRSAVTGNRNEMDVRVTASVLPDGPRIFPADFLNGDVGSIRTVELPEQELVIRQLAGGGHAVESHFGFRHDVRNETEGMFILFAHNRGVYSLDIPNEMIHLFKAVKGYQSYLRTVWCDLYRAYGLECGDTSVAYDHAKTAFDTFGLPLPDEATAPVHVEGIGLDEKNRDSNVVLARPRQASTCRSSRLLKN